MWIWFWGICIPNSYGSGTTRARGAPLGVGRTRCFRVPPFHGSLVGAPRQWRFARTGLPFGPNLVSAHAHRMPLRHSGRPVQHLPAHPAAPLGSGAAFRRPVSFAPYHPPFPSLPQVCGGEKRASPLQACVKCAFGVFQGGLRVALCRGCVIGGVAKLRRYRQSRQCPTRRGRPQTAAPSTMGKQKHWAAKCRLPCFARAHSCARPNNQQQPNRKEQNHEAEEIAGCNQGHAGQELGNPRGFHRQARRLCALHPEIHQSRSQRERGLTSLSESAGRV